ncbi:MAG: nucleotidyltransferase domain-containing protein [Prevotella sp.]|nr:nucleotidyltransferase domain-containing protein [Prevotella sp.]
MNRQSITKAISDYFETQPVVRAWLFGSFARGEETPESDVDLLVVYDENARVSLLTHAGMVVDLEDILHRPVDIVEDGTLKPWALESANRDKKLIYERAY